MSTVKYYIVCCLTFLTLTAFAQDPVSHVVVKGETVASIAKKYNVSESALLEENPILKNYIYVGMKIRIPNANPQAVTEEQPKTPEAPVKETVVVENTAATVATVTTASPKAEPKKTDNYIQQSFFPERTPGTFSPHRQYGGLSFCLPTLEGLGDQFFAWGVDMTGFGYQFFFARSFFLDASGHVIFRHSNTKQSKDWEFRTNEFAIHFPIMVGWEISGFQLRAGGFLEYTVLGWTASKLAEKTTRTLFSAINPAPNRFYYGVRIDASFGFVDVGFILSWQPKTKDITKALSVGYRF